MAMNLIDGGSPLSSGGQLSGDACAPDADAAPTFESRLRAAQQTAEPMEEDSELARDDPPGRLPARPAPHRVAPHAERSPRRPQEQPEDGSPPAWLASTPSLPATTVPPDAQAAAPSPLTPNDVAAAVAVAWVASPSGSATGHAGFLGTEAQWTFALEDPLTPLALLRVSGDPAAGWTLRVTAGQGLSPHHLAGRAERLRRRLLARGQPVARLDVDEESP